MLIDCVIGAVRKRSLSKWNFFLVCWTLNKNNEILDVELSEDQKRNN